jgi:hypothetical protein
LERERGKSGVILSAIRDDSSTAVIFFNMWEPFYVTARVGRIHLGSTNAYDIAAFGNGKEERMRTVKNDGSHLIHNKR